MNIILFESREIERPIPADDRRAVHLLNILKVRRGDTFDLGIVDGPRGKGTVSSIRDGSIVFRADLEHEVPELYPLTLIVGAVRPPAARRILKDSATLGLSALYVFASEKGEASYLKSRVWKEETARRLFIEGAEQGFTTRIPSLRLFENLTAAVATLPGGTSRAALDTYEASVSLHAWQGLSPCALALGSERGWSERERMTLREAGFTLVSLGRRVMRTETAVIAASALTLSNLGYW